MVLNDAGLQTCNCNDGPTEVLSGLREKVKDESGRKLTTAGNDDSDNHDDASHFVLTDSLK